MLGLLHSECPEGAAKSVRLCPAALIAFALWPTAAPGQTPDPLALLRGFEQARTAIRTGKVEMAVVKQQLKPNAQKDDVALTVVFDGDRRTVNEKYRALKIKGSGGDGGASKLKKLEAMNNDREAFVRAGLGEWENVHVRSSWNGSDFSQYNESMGASIRNHRKGSPDLMFDPRLLGVFDYRQMYPTLADSFTYKKAKSVNLVGQEQVGKHLAWKVQVVADGGVEQLLWLEDREGFRIHKFKQTDANGEVELVSEYHDVDRGALPAKVTYQFFRNKELVRQMVVQVTKAELGVPVASSVGTLGSLGLPVGEAVSDERIGRRLGYWNGEGLSDDPRAAKKIGEQRLAETAPSSAIWGLGFPGTAVALAVLGAAYGVRRWMRGR